MRKIIAISIGLVLLGGCQSTKNQSEFERENNSLKQQLQSAQAEIGQLKGNNVLLSREIENLNHVVSVLGTEKQSRTVESSVLRGKVRSFVQNQVDYFRGFLIEGDLLDYVGGELVQRPNTEDKPVTVVDLNNAFKSSGLITGLGAFVMRPSTVKVAILRNIDKNLVVLWQSEPIKLTSTGKVTYQFANSVSVEAGDIVAYQFQDNAGVGYDVGTGNARYSNEQLLPGKTVSVSSLLGERDRRAYSIGVYGLLSQ